MTFSGSSLGNLELQLTANQLALQAQLNQTRAYATRVARDIELQINRAFGGRRNTQLPGLQNASSQAASAGTSAGKSFADKFKDAIAPLKGAISNIFSGVFVGAGIGAFNAVTGAIQTAIGAVQGFAGQIFNVTKDFQGFEASLKTFLKGNQQEIDKFVAGLEKFAATTPFELKDLQQAAIQNLATGAKPDQIIKDLKSIGDVAAGANANLKDLMEVYAKSRTEGRLQNEDIDQFTGRGVQLRAELAKMLGATEQEVRQLATDGKLEFRHLEEAIRRMSAQGGAYFGAMENKAKTLEGRLSNVNDTFYQFQKSIGQAFEPLMNYGVQVFGDIVSGLTSSKGVLSEVKKESQKLVEYFKANPQLVEALNKAIQELVSGGFQLLLGGIKNVAEYLQENPNFIQDATDKINALFGVVRSVLGTVSSIVSWINGAIAWGLQLFNEQLEKAQPRFEALLELCEAIADFFKQHGDLVKQLSDALSFVVNTLLKIFIQLLTQAVKIITQIVSYFRDNLPGAIQGFSQGLEKVLDVCKQIGQAIFGWVSGITGAAQQAGSFVGGLFGGGQQQPQQQPERSQNTSGGTGNFIGNLIQGTQNLVGGGVGRAIQGVQGLLGGSSNSNRGVAGQVTLRRIGVKDEYGLEKIAVILPDGQTFYATSGQRRTQNQFGRGGTTRSGSMAPIEYGKYNIGAETAGIGAGVGATFIPINPTFKTQRSAIGFHLDANRSVAPGSAGCVVFSTQQEFNAFRAALKRSGAKQLVFEEGQGIGIADAAQGVSVGKVTSAGGFLGEIANQVQKILPTGAGLSSKAANVVRGKNEGIFQQAGVTDKLVELVKQAEGFAATPYWDRTQYSVGFGTKAKSQSERLTVEQANERLLQELQSKRSRVQSMVKVPLNTNQLDALTSFAFNVGDGALQKSTLLKKLNAGDYAGAAAEFGRWNKGEHRGVKQELPGLTRRRKAERDLFLSQSTVNSQQSIVNSQQSIVSSQQSVPTTPTGGNEEDQRNLVAARRRLAQQKYREIKEEIDFATQQADATQKQQRELAAQKREQLNKEKKAQLQLAAAQAPDDEAKNVIEKRLSRFEIDSKYEEDLIKLAQQREDLTDARDKKLQIIAEAKKRGQTVDLGEEGGKDYTKAINQLDEIIASTRELQKIELETNNLNESNSEQQQERDKDRQRELEKLTRDHEKYINQLKLQQSLVNDEPTKQKIQLSIDKAETEYQAKLALAPLQNQLDDLQERKVYLLGKGGLKDDSEEVKRLQKEIDNLVAQIHSLANNSDIDLSVFENQRKQIELQSQRLREAENQELQYNQQVTQLRSQISEARTQQQKAELQFQIDKLAAMREEQQLLQPLKQQYDDLVKSRERLINEGKVDASSEAVKTLDAEIARLNNQIQLVGEQSKISFETLAQESQKAIEQAKFADMEAALNKDSGLVGGRASVLQGQATLIRNRGGDEYRASALEAEAAKMQEQIRYKQELLQIEQQIASVRGTASEYTEEEIATMKANAEALNKINLENISSQVRTLGKDLMDVAKNALGTFFTDIITGSKSASEAFQDLIGNIANQLAQLAVNKLISGLFGGGLFGGGGGGGGGGLNGGGLGLLGGLFGGGNDLGLLGFYQGGIVPNYASGGSVGAIANALQRERAASGRNPVLAALTPGEMVLTVEQAKRFQELRLDKVLNFANGGIVGKASAQGQRADGEGMTINIPVTVQGSNPTSVDVPRLQSSIRGVVVEELLKQQRPGGALNR
jgi:GH24 family phage-related lysozyme (muramidase)/phage-related protein